MNGKRILTYLLLSSFLIIIYSFSQKEKQEVFLSEIQTPLSFEEFTLEEILNCTECKTKTLDLSNYPAKNFFRDVWLMKEDSLFSGQDISKCNWNILIQTDLNGEKRNFILDTRTKMYFFEGKYFKISEANYLRLEDIASIF